MGALVKALLINSGEALTGNYNDGRLDTILPDPVQGFGRMLLKSTLLVGDSGIDDPQQTLFVNGQMDNMPLLAQGQVDEYKFR